MGAGHIVKFPKDGETEVFLIPRSHCGGILNLPGNVFHLHVHIAFIGPWVFMRRMITRYPAVRAIRSESTRGIGMEWQELEKIMAKDIPS